MKQDIRDFTPIELIDRIKDLSLPQYRVRQILRWLYQAGAKSFDEMKDIPVALREKLSRSYTIGVMKATKHLISRDGTEKLLFELQDGNFIETVLIPAPDRKTVCVSTQVGCRFGCGFCASGARGFIRDLTPSEITGQVLYLKHKLGRRVTNVVFMGIGEPLDNIDSVMKAIMITNSPIGMNIASRRITVSTCGIIPGIARLEKLGLQVNLSISLHATDDNVRNRLMPVNKKYPIKPLLKAAQDYYDRTGRKLFLDYIVLKGVNDSDEDADRLSAMAKKLKATVNLIERHDRSGEVPIAPAAADIKGFMRRLKDKKVNVTLRTSRGLDIQAGCGQLRAMEN